MANLMSHRFKRALAGIKSKERKSPVYEFDEPDNPSNIVLQEGTEVVMAGTLVKLVQRLTYERKPDPDFVQAFLLTYHSFVTPNELLDLLFQRYDIPLPSGKESIEQFEKKRKLPIQLRVINVLKYWLGNFKADFGADDEVTHRLLHWIDTNLVHPDAQSQALLQLKRILHLQLEENEQNAPIVDLSVINDEDGTSMIGPPEPQAPAPSISYAESSYAQSEVDPDDFSPPMSPTLQRKGFLGWASRKSNHPSISSISATLLAHQITLVEHDMYARIPLREFIGLGWAKADKSTRAPNVLAIIQRFNEVSSWVSTEILHGGPRPKDRAVVLKKFIRAAKELYNVNNFNGVMNILAGLNAASVFRLKKTWAEAGEKHIAIFEELQDIMNPKGSFKKFREHIHNVNPPCMPYLGIYLTDLTFIEDGNKDLTADGLINFEKRRKVAKVIREIKQYQQVRYSFQPNETIINFLTTLPAGLPEADQHKLSLEIEPRESRS